MGVDLGSYRLRIGLFNGAAFKQTKASSIDVAIIVFGVMCGTLLFIQALLVEQGIEPNPGPWTLELLFCCIVTSILGIFIIFWVHRRKQSTSDRTNFVLMCRLLIDVCADLLREVLIAETAPDSLAVTLHRIQNKIPNVYKNQLYPPGGFKGSYDDLDVSVLCCMLRNIGTIPPHNQGWGRDPHNSDRSLSANIDRIRIQRNKGFGHLTTTCMSDNEFKKGWKVIKRCVKEIQNHKTTKTDYLAEMNRLKEEVISSETEHRYIEKYRELHKIVEETHDGVKDVKDSICKLERTIVSQTDELHEAIDDGTDTLKQVFVDQNKAVQEVIVNRNKGDKHGARIETTKTTIDRCTKDHFVPTKVFEDAKSKLLQRNIVVLKGNSGDGKTRTAYELMAWMWKGDNSAGDRYNKLPIQFYNLDNWDDSLKPNMNLCILIDDVSTDLFKEIEKKHELIKSLISGEMNGKSNCLVITLRNDVFKSMSSSSIFVEENVVDTSSEEYYIKEEKEHILDIYLPKEVKFSKTERSEIVESAPDIGFPQCCRLYRDVPELQEQGMKFFQQPFHFMKIALSNLENGRCAALLYLFFCGGKFETDLDVFSDEIDKKKLQAAFEVKLLKDVKIPDLSSDVKKIEFVMESLDGLCGSLVVKDTEYKWKDGHYITYEYYKFSHDSIRDTVALLYGEKTKIGFIKNCHCNSLCYITTSKNTPNKIFIDPDNKHMYSRLLRELKSKHSENYKCIASLDVWNDSQFMSGFFRWLDGEGIDKDFYLKWTTEDVDRHGPYHFYTDRGDRYRGLMYYTDRGDRYRGLMYYTDRGDRYRGHFPSFLVYVAHTNNLCLLNQLLERTPKDHPQLHGVLFGAVRSGHIDVFNMIIERGINPTVRAKWSQSSHVVWDINVLHEACLFERVEMVTKLATKYPSLVHDTCDYKLPTLHVVVQTGNCSLYDTMETFILGDISREDRVKHLSEMVNGGGRTVLLYSCLWCGCSNTMVLHLLHKYPELASIRDKCGYHCLHYIAFWSNKDLFIQVDSYLQKYYKGINYDITTIVDKDGQSVLDLAKEEWRDEEDV